MNRFFKRGMALALTLVMTTATLPHAAASQALGDDLHTGTVGLAPGALLTRNLFWSSTYSDLRTERYVTYTPGSGVYPVAVFGDKVLTKQNLSVMAKNLESYGHRVVAGVNGDFFDMATGNTLGVLISDGVLRSTAGGFSAVGFREDGSAFIASPDIAVTATFLGQTLQITDVNKTRTALSDKKPGGYYLYTEDYSRTTQHTSPGIDVILTPVTEGVGQQVDVNLDVSTPGELSPETAQPETPSGPPEGIPTGIADSRDLGDQAVPSAVDEVAQISGTLTQSSKLTVGGRLSCTVDAVLQSTGSIDIPAGKLVLTINNTNPEWLVSQLAALKAGDRVDIDVTAPDARWADASTAVGGFYRIVTGGKPGPNADASANPRTAIGVKADGSVVFYTIDGKQPGYSVGGTLTQVAQRMIELGCVDAVGMDGGGSTTMVATMPLNTASEILNKPSDGSPRAVSTALFLLSDLKASGVLDHFYLTPYDSMLLSGATVPLTVNPMDSAYYPMTYGGVLSWSINNGDGLVSADGVFTASGESGTAQVVATGGGVSGTAYMTVVSTPDSIALSLEGGAAITALSLEPNQSMDLKANAVYKKLPLTSQDPCYTWTLDPAVGTVDANGVITAGSKTASGTLTVSAGGRSTSIPISVTGHIKGLETFESGVGSFTSSDSATVAPETSGDLVRFGSQSLKLTYDAAASGTAAAGAAYAIPAGERYLGLWVYGDGSGNALTASFTDAAGNVSDAALTGLDFTGWKQVVAEMPEGAVSLRSVNVVYTGGEQQSGSLWLDQLTTSNENTTDAVAPTVKLTLDGDKVTALVSDNLQKRFSQSAITLTMDGVSQSFTWNEEKSTLSATLPAADARLHRITVTASDDSGNLGRASVDRLPAADMPQPSTPFVDMTAHWALPYTTYLHDKGIVSGVSTNAGMVFKPDANITRAEFALMVGRWKGLDLESYASVELPFADVASIPSWALNGIKAMYAEGIVKGSLDNGVLVSRATATISRAEAMTILGRIQPKGYESKPLTFSDAGKVPAWSLDYVQTLVKQGVISGFENQLRPNDPIKRCEVAKMLYTLL